MDLVPYRHRRGSALARLEDEFSDLFRRFFGDWRPFGVGEGGWAPALDFAERDDAVVVKVDLPGVKNDDIDISVQDGTLTIRGEKKEESEDKGEGYRYVERRYGSFQRQVALPTGVDPDKVEANYAEGVLTVTLGKDESAKPRRIAVKAK